MVKFSLGHYMIRQTSVNKSHRWYRKQVMRFRSRKLNKISIIVKWMSFKTSKTLFVSGQPQGHFDRTAEVLCGDGRTWQNDNHPFSIKPFWCVDRSHFLSKKGPWLHTCSFPKPCKGFSRFYSLIKSRLDTLAGMSSFTSGWNQPSLCWNVVLVAIWSGNGSQ